jgi:hypothetical protein
MIWWFNSSIGEKLRFVVLPTIAITLILWALTIFKENIVIGWICILTSILIFNLALWIVPDDRKIKGKLHTE